MAVCNVVNRDDSHVIADGRDRQAVFYNALPDELAYDFRELFVLFVLDHERSKLGVKAVENHDISIAYFVEDGDDVPFAKRSIGSGVDAVNVFNETIVADDAISQGSPSDAAVLCEAFAQFYRLVKRSKRHLSVEVRVMNIIGAEIVCHIDILPILCRATLSFEGCHFALIKFPHKPIFLPT